MRRCECRGVRSAARCVRNSSFRTRAAMKIVAVGCDPADACATSRRWWRRLSRLRHPPDRPGSCRYLRVGAWRRRKKQSPDDYQPYRCDTPTAACAAPTSPVDGAGAWAKAMIALSAGDDANKRGALASPGNAGVIVGYRLAWTARCRRQQTQQGDRLPVRRSQRRKDGRAKQVTRGGNAEG